VVEFAGVAIFVWGAVKFSGTRLSFFLMLLLIRTRKVARVSSLQYFAPPVTMLIAWPAFGEASSLLGFVELFITAGGFFIDPSGRASRGSPTG
jgi:drug/metabolite transporter (DMT)-like permease